MIPKNSSGKDKQVNDHYHTCKNNILFEFIFFKNATHTKLLVKLNKIIKIKKR